MNTIKYWEAVGNAWRRMVEILFHPFNFEKWFVMGFAAWLAGLNAGGGSGSGGNSFGNNSYNSQSCSTGDALAQFWAEYGMLIVTIGGGLVLFIIALTIVFTWLQARGKFIFLDNVIHNRAAIVEPWKKYRTLGNSFFLWNIIVGFFSIIILLMILVIPITMAWPMITCQTQVPIGIAGIFVGVVLFLIYLLYFSYLYLFAYDFVLPLMMKYDEGIQAGWQRFSTLYRQRKSTFLVYGLVRYLLSLGAGMAIIAIGLLSCCCLFIVAAIPYIGTVLMLPIFVFYRLISLEFIRQFGEDFDVEADLISVATKEVPPELPAASDVDQPIAEEPIDTETKDFTDDPSSN